MQMLPSCSYHSPSSHPPGLTLVAFCTAQPPALCLRARFNPHSRAHPARAADELRAQNRGLTEDLFRLRGQQQQQQQQQQLKANGELPSGRGQRGMAAD